MRRRGRTLFGRIYFYTLGVLLLVGCTVMAMGSLVARPRVLHEYAERIVLRLAARVQAGLDDPPRRDALLRDIAESFELDVTLRRSDGQLIDSVGAPLPPPLPRELEALRGGPLMSSPRLLQERRRWFAAAPVYDEGGRPRALLQVSFRRHMHPPSVLWPALAIALVLILVGASTLRMSRRLTRPIDELGEANRRLGAGDLAYRIPVSSGSPRRHYDDELRALQRSWNEMAGRIEALVRSQKELLANVSHELRSPLSRIRVALALLPEDPALQRRLGDIEADLGELERLIDDVLTTSRLEASGLPLRRERLQAGPLLQALAERGGATVHIEAGPAVELEADPALLRRALWNLIENAHKYGAPPVTLAAAAEGAAVVFTVSDEGPGVPAAERRRVLEPFYRLDRARTPGTAQGVGLGLTLARQIAEVHGGELSLGPARVSDGQEIGLRVTLRVPARPSSPASPGR